MTEALAVEPNRVQPMHRYRVSAWYPYADASGRIHDPKTTVAVGLTGLTRLRRSICQSATTTVNQRLRRRAVVSPYRNRINFNAR
ncbi:MAG: virulence factor SrfB [Anaerolineae bacterium]|nr:virulence factor SrfB [Anaerolineae bacterium]